MKIERSLQTCTVALDMWFVFVREQVTSAMTLACGRSVEYLRQNPVSLFCVIVKLNQLTLPRVKRGDQQGKLIKVA